MSQATTQAGTSASKSAQDSPPNKDLRGLMPYLRRYTGGIIFGLLTGLFFAIYNLEGKTASDKNIDSWTALLYSFSTAAFFLFMFNLIVNIFSKETLFANFMWLGSSYTGWSILFFLGVVPTLGGFGLYTLSLRYLSPTIANLIATLEPALTAIWAYLFLHELLIGPQLLGSCLIFTGVILLRLGERPEPAPLME